VYPGEVEAALLALPAVSQAAVIGQATANGNEEIIAFVRLRPGWAADAAALQAELGARLAPYKRPGRIQFVPEFPLGPTGKVLKTRLLAQVATPADQPTARPPATASCDRW
jgi:acyl-coenzyme A synthetase/AMP-(fatty) acid ligase